MFSESQIKRAQEKGVLPPSDEIIQEPGRYNIFDLMGVNIKEEDKDHKNGFEIRKVFDKGINSNNSFVRGTTQIVKYVYDSGIILGGALVNKPEEGNK